MPDLDKANGKRISLVLSQSEECEKANRMAVNAEHLLVLCSIGKDVSDHLIHTQVMGMG